MLKYVRYNINIGTHDLINGTKKRIKFEDYFVFQIIFTPQPLRAVGVLFSPMVSGQVGGWQEKVCPGCISETVRCRKLILGRYFG